MVSSFSKKGTVMCIVAFVLYVAHVMVTFKLSTPMGITLNLLAGFSMTICVWAGIFGVKPEVVEKIVEVEKRVEIEKVVEVFPETEVKQVANTQKNESEQKITRPSTRRKSIRLHRTKMRRRNI